MSHSDFQSFPVVILGAGVTGLAASIASGFPIYEACSHPGGICSSYYLQPGTSTKLLQPPTDEEAYRFELGGGHWTFGGDPLVHCFIENLTPVKTYIRDSAVYFPDTKQLIPYPIQNQLRYLAPEIAMKALQEMIAAQLAPRPVTTMSDWLEHSFGPTLGKLFFHPFHQLYTAGLWQQIAPQDSYKSPVDLKLAVQGVFQNAPPVGYNATFIYPQLGLDALVQKMANQCTIYFNKKAVRIVPNQHCIEFSDGTQIQYSTLLATIPLNRLMEITNLDVGAKPDPSPSVLVVNIGGLKTPQTPTQQWIYIPHSRSHFHRVGFYSNVDRHFLPKSRRDTTVSLYIEKAYPEGTHFADMMPDQVCQDIIAELQSWGWIGDVEVFDPTWIEAAYTWSWSGSNWKNKAQNLLQQYQIYPIGRYARWVFQGIADSIRDGLMAGSALKR